MTPLQNLLQAAQHIVFFGGAGVSTASGIPDFRSAKGLFRKKSAVSPETMLSASYFYEHPEEYFAFYREHILFPGAKPNRAHLALAKLEQQGKLTAVITQNIDGLHQLAGSKTVLELHGSVHKNRCLGCGKFASLAEILAIKETVPRCACGAIIKPEVVLYGEQLDEAVLRAAQQAIAKADLVIVGGTSLVVYPAAGLLRGFGGTLVVINRDPTPLDSSADLLITDSIDTVLWDAVQ